MSLTDSLRKLPHYDLLDGETPIQRLPGIEEATAASAKGIGIYVKRDDFMSIGGGGNKLRKLEFLLGDALRQGADTIVATGGRQSNFARLAAASAARAGLKCELVLSRMVPRDGDEYDRNGNVLLDDLFGAHIHHLDAGADATAFAEARARELQQAGRTAYVALLGGSSAVGSVGYASCALEIAKQSDGLGIDFTEIVLPNGSSGTHAGLAAGYKALGRDPKRIRSHSVLAVQSNAIASTMEKANAVLALLGIDGALDETDINISGKQLGDGYGIPTAAMFDAVRLLANREGLLTDPVYSGKAFAGLLDDIATGRYKAGDNVLFLMTGGSPGLYAYAREFLNR